MLSQFSVSGFTVSTLAFRFKAPGFQSESLAKSMATIAQILIWFFGIKDPEPHGGQQTTLHRATNPAAGLIVLCGLLCLSLSGAFCWVLQPNKPNSIQGLGSLLRCGT